MVFKWLLIILLVIIAGLGGAVVWIFGRTPVPETKYIPSPASQMTTEPNVTVIISQSGVNDMLAAIFPIRGEGANGTVLRIPYSWSIQNPHVDMEPEGPTFSAEAQLRILGRTIAATAQGTADIRYDSTSNDLYMDVHEIKAHTDAKILGIPLERFNLAPEWVNVGLLRHLPLGADFIVKKPEGLRENVELSVAGYKIHFEKHQAIIEMTVCFKELSQGK